MSPPLPVMPVVAMAIAAADRDGHDESDDGCHGDEADGSRQDGGSFERVVAP